MKNIEALEVGPYRQPCEVTHFDDEALREFVKERMGTPLTEKDIHDKSAYFAQGSADYHAPAFYVLPLLVFYGASLLMARSGMFQGFPRWVVVCALILGVLLSAVVGRKLKGRFFRQQKGLQERMIRAQMETPGNILHAYYQKRIAHLTERFADRKVAAKEGAKIWADLNGIHVDYCRSLLNELVETLARWPDVDGRPYVLDRAKALADELEMRLRALEAFDAVPISDREGQESVPESVIDRLHHAYTNLPPLPRYPVSNRAPVSAPVQHTLPAWEEEDEEVVRRAQRNG